MRAPLPSLDAYWMPFTANRSFKSSPRFITRAAGTFVYDRDGREVLDAIAGLWCCNAGHCHPRVTAAIREQTAVLDYATAFQMGHDGAFELAERLAAMAPAGLDRVFFTNSGSESVDTALKIAVGYHRARGEGTRTRLIGRERAYHGVGFGGISVGGMVANRRGFGPLLPGTDHLPHTHDPARNAFSRGQPNHGAELADALERLVALHDASTIAAVIVEPVAGSTGVLVPPVGYLERLRELCSAHGILLIFDEVITGFGRCGANFAAQRLGVTPDLITCAKGLTNGAVPMGAVLASRAVHDAFMAGPPRAIELYHGYTYSGHPLACAAALATLDVHAQERLPQQARSLEPAWQDALHSLDGLPGVIDIRNFGLVGAIELEPVPGMPTARAMDVFRRAWDERVLVRTTGDTIALSPPLNITPDHVDRIVSALRKVLAASGPLAA